MDMFCLPADELILVHVVTGIRTLDVDVIRTTL